MPSPHSSFSSFVRRFAGTPLSVLVLVAIAGGVDALVMTHSRDLLAVYMTGNSTKLGQSLVRGAYDKSASLLCVIVCFFIATTLAAWIGVRVPARRAVLCLALTAVALAAAMPFAGQKYSLAGTCFIASGMGAINQARADETGVTFITGALVRTGRQLADGKFRAAAIGLLRWIALIAGAAIGTVMDLHYGNGALAATLQGAHDIRSSSEGGLTHAHERPR